MTFKYEINCKPFAGFSLSLATINAIIGLSQHHYDYECKKASGEEGFLTQWRKSIVLCEEHKLTWMPISAEFRQIDTCLKIMEMAKYSSDPEILRLCSETSFRFMKLCHEINKAATSTEGELL